MSKLDAFREAQLWKMKEGRNCERIEIEDYKSKQPPPYYWAAIVLFGD